MQIGFIGLGKMGQKMVSNLIDKGHQVVAYDTKKGAYRKLRHKNLVCAASIRDLSLKITSKPKIIWLMITSRSDEIDKVVFSKNGLADCLNKGDIIIDGGNSHFSKSIERSNKLKHMGIDYVDCGCSGGPDGVKSGLSITVGGDNKTYKKILPILESLAASGGLAYVGPSGSGHFVKMVHNAIEYGMMESFAEGFELLKRGPYKKLNLSKIAHTWNHGAVVRSFLCEKIEQVMSQDKDLKNFKDYVEDTGEGRWALIEAINNDVHFYTLATALFARYRSREEDDYSLKLLSALRNAFGGHKAH